MWTVTDCNKNHLQYFRSRTNYAWCWSHVGLNPSAKQGHLDSQQARDSVDVGMDYADPVLWSEGVRLEVYTKDKERPTGTDILNTIEMVSLTDALKGIQQQISCLEAIYFLRDILSMHYFLPWAM